LVGEKPHRITKSFRPSALAFILSPERQTNFKQYFTRQRADKDKSKNEPQKKSIVSAPAASMQCR
jgi:hypothetical protein